MTAGICPSCCFSDSTLRCKHKKCRSYLVWKSEQPEPHIILSSYNFFATEVEVKPARAASPAAQGAAESEQGAGGPHRGRGGNICVRPWLLGYTTDNFMDDITSAPQFDVQAKSSRWFRGGGKWIWINNFIIQK